MSRRDESSGLWALRSIYPTGRLKAGTVGSPARWAANGATLNVEVGHIIRIAGSLIPKFKTKVLS